MRSTALWPDIIKSRIPRLLLTALATTLLVAIATGCGSNKTSSAAPSATSSGTSSETSAAASGATPAAAGKSTGSNTVDGVMKEYTITLGKTTVAAGNVKFTISNKGQMLHEFIVIKTDLPADKLPKAKSGEDRVDEDSHALTVIGEIEDLNPGETDTKTFNLPAGNYVLICNKPGHYGYGQYTTLKAR